MIDAFAGLYIWTGAVPEKGKLSDSNFWPSVGQALSYSLAAMTRQRWTLPPMQGMVQFLIVLEGILGPLQIALFALALRRKFMK